jgi:hypothetical protein
MTHDDPVTSVASYPSRATALRPPEAERLTWVLRESASGYGLACDAEVAAALRDATCDYALALRALGLSVPQALAAAREVVSTAREPFRGSLRSQGAAPIWAELAERVAVWTAAVYEGANPGALADRREGGPSRYGRPRPNER